MEMRVDMTTSVSSRHYMQEWSYRAMGRLGPRCHMSTFKYMRVDLRGLERPCKTRIGR